MCDPFVHHFHYLSILSEILGKEQALSLVRHTKSEAQVHDY